MTNETHGLTLTKMAQAEALALVETEDQPGLAFRIAVHAGGCSGFRYELSLDDRHLDGDLVKNFDGLDVVVDASSAPYLDGAVVDYADLDGKKGFTIDNPNTAGTCACSGSC